MFYKLKIKNFYILAFPVNKNMSDNFTTGPGTNLDVIGYFDRSFIITKTNINEISATTAAENSKHSFVNHFSFFFTHYYMCTKCK